MLAAKETMMIETRHVCTGPRIRRHLEGHGKRLSDRSVYRSEHPRPSTALQRSALSPQSSRYQESIARVHGTRKRANGRLLSLVTVGQGFCHQPWEAHMEISATAPRRRSPRSLPQKAGGFSLLLDQSRKLSRLAIFRQETVAESAADQLPHFEKQRTV